MAGSRAGAVLEAQHRPGPPAKSTPKPRPICPGVPNAVVYWGVLAVLAAAARVVFPWTVTSAYLVSCGLLTAWRGRKGEDASFQPGAAPRGWNRRRWRSVAVSLANCVIADLALWRWVRAVNPPLLYQFDDGVPGVLGVAWLYLSPLVLLLVHDAWFYACHRALHAWGPGYRYVHSVHHQLDAPEAWDLFYMHPAEAAVAVVLPFVVTPRMFPLHWVIWEGLVLKGILIDCYGHCGFEAAPFHPFKLTQFSLWPGFPWRAIFLTAEHHDEHHRRRHGNYALYLDLWDKVLGTELSPASGGG